MKVGRFYRSIASLVVFSFTTFNILGYAPSARAQQEKGTGLSDNLNQSPVPFSASPIFIPSSLGTIEEFHKGKSEKTIIYIQDAHDSLQAQENISKIINHLVSEQNVRTVFEEGYEGAVPTDAYFNFIKDPKMKEKVSYFFLDKLRIGGAEYAHINRKQDFKLVGADSIALHHENNEWYRETAKHKKEIKEDLGAIENEIKKLADQNFPKPLKNWMKIKKRFDEGKLDLASYLGQAVELWEKARKGTSAQEHRSDATFHTRYPRIYLILAAGQAKDQNNEFTKKLQEMDPKALFQEINDFENDVSHLFLENNRDYETFQYYRAIQLLKRLYEIELDPSEYEVVKEMLVRLSTENIARFISAQTNKSVVLSRLWEELVRNAMRFYEIAHSRDQAVEEPLGVFMKKPDEKVAAIVFGGFHKNKFKEIFEKQNLSYAIIAPKITEISKRHQGYYKQLMSVGRLPFELPINSQLRIASRVLPLWVLSNGSAEVRQVYDVMSRSPDLTLPLIDRALVDLSRSSVVSPQSSVAVADDRRPKADDLKARSEHRGTQQVFSWDQSNQIFSRGGAWFTFAISSLFSLLSARLYYLNSYYQVHDSTKYLKALWISVPIAVFSGAYLAIVIVNNVRRLFANRRAELTKTIIVNKEGNDSHQWRMEITIDKKWPGSPFKSYLSLIPTRKQGDFRDDPTRSAAFRIISIEPFPIRARNLDEAQHMLGEIQTEAETVVRSWRVPYGNDFSLFAGWARNEYGRSEVRRLEDRSTQALMKAGKSTFDVSAETSKRAEARSKGQGFDMSPVSRLAELKERWSIKTWEEEIDRAFPEKFGKGKTVFVTGGAGYIGSFTVRMLLALGHKVIVYDDLSQGHGESLPKSGNVVFVPGRLDDKEKMQQVMKQYGVESVVHFAAFTQVGESVREPSKYYLNNVINTHKLLEAMKGASVRDIVFSSSSAAINPENPYGWSKRYMEDLLREYVEKEDFNVTAFRYFNAAGDATDIGEDHYPESHLIGVFAPKMLRGEDVTIFGDQYKTRDGTNERDYIHVYDLAFAHALALRKLLDTRKKSKEERFHAFSLGTGETYTNKEVAKEIQRQVEEITGKPYAGEIKIGKLRDGDPDKLQASYEEAQAYLGWTPKYSKLEKNVESALVWYFTHPHGYGTSLRTDWRRFVKWLNGIEPFSMIYRLVTLILSGERTLGTIDLVRKTIFELSKDSVLSVEFKIRLLRRILLDEANKFRIADKNKAEWSVSGLIRWIKKHEPMQYAAIWKLEQEIERMALAYMPRQARAEAREIGNNTKENKSVIPASFWRESMNNGSPTKDFGDDRIARAEARLSRSDAKFLMLMPLLGFAVYMGLCVFDEYRRTGNILPFSKPVATAPATTEISDEGVPIFDERFLDQHQAESAKGRAEARSIKNNLKRSSIGSEQESSQLRRRSDDAAARATEGSTLELPQGSSKRAEAREEVLQYKDFINGMNDGTVAFAMIKPDGIQKAYSIIVELGLLGFDVYEAPEISVDQATAEKFYGIHKEKPFYAGLVKYMTSGKVVPLMLVFRQPEAIDKLRKALPALREKFGIQKIDGIDHNKIQASDSKENALAEAKLIVDANPEIKFTGPHIRIMTDEEIEEASKAWAKTVGQPVSQDKAEPAKVDFLAVAKEVGMTAEEIQFLVEFYQHIPRGRNLNQSTLNEMKAGYRRISKGVAAFNKFHKAVAQSKWAKTFKKTPNLGCSKLIWDAVRARSEARAETVEEIASRLTLEQIPLQTILIVEDEAFWRGLYRAQFENLQRTVRIEYANNAEEALAKIRELGKVGLVVTDYSMPGMRGNALLQHLRRELNLNVPVIICTTQFATTGQEIVRLIKGIANHAVVYDKNIELVAGVIAELLKRSEARQKRFGIDAEKEAPLWKNWKFLTVAMVAAFFVAGFFYHQHAVSRSKEWDFSKSGQDIVQMDQARQTKDVARIIQIARNARARHDRMIARITEAEKQGAKKVDDATRDKLSLARRYAAFDLFIASAADLQVNEISQNTDQRPGGEFLPTWQQELDGFEKGAIRMGFEGNLARRLRDLQSEIDRENREIAEWTAWIGDFEKAVPMLFAGGMKKELKAAETDLKEFSETERNPEQSLFDAKNMAMRGRVSEKLYGQNPEFKVHRDRRDRLQTLFNQKINPVVGMANQIVRDLDKMISERQTEAMNQVAAEANSHVLVQKSETTYDQNGNAHTRYWTEYEDHSLSYRILAAAAASAAKNAARRANDGLAKLKQELSALGGDPIFKSENLLLPGANMNEVAGGHGALFAFFGPSLWNVFGSMSSASDGSRAKSEFESILRTIEALSREVQTRLQGEINLVEQAISQDLMQQMSLPWTSQPAEYDPNWNRAAPQPRSEVRGEFDENKRYLVKIRFSGHGESNDALKRYLVLMGYDPANITFTTELSDVDVAADHLMQGEPPYLTSAQGPAESNQYHAHVFLGDDGSDDPESYEKLILGIERMIAVQFPEFARARMPVGTRSNVEADRLAMEINAMAWEIGISLGSKATNTRIRVFWGPAQLHLAEVPVWYYGHAKHQSLGELAVAEIKFHLGLRPNRRYEISQSGQDILVSFRREPAHNKKLFLRTIGFVGFNGGLAFLYYVLPQKAFIIPNLILAVAAFLTITILVAMYRKSVLSVGADMLERLKKSAEQARRDLISEYPPLTERQQREMSRDALMVYYRMRAILLKKYDDVLLRYPDVILTDTLVDTAKLILNRMKEQESEGDLILDAIEGSTDLNAHFAKLIDRLNDVSQRVADDIEASGVRSEARANEVFLTGMEFLQPESERETKGVFNNLEALQTWMEAKIPSKLKIQAMGVPEDGNQANINFSEMPYLAIKGEHTTAYQEAIEAVALYLEGRDGEGRQYRVTLAKGQLSESAPEISVLLIEPIEEGDRGLKVPARLKPAPTKGHGRFALREPGYPLKTRISTSRASGKPVEAEPVTVGKKARSETRLNINSTKTGIDHGVQKSSQLRRRQSDAAARAEARSGTDVPDTSKHFRTGRSEVRQIFAVVEKPVVTSGMDQVPQSFPKLDASAQQSKTLRVAMAQISPRVGDLEGNFRKIVAQIKQAELQGSDMIVFPELIITGYPPEDLLYKKHFIQQNQEVLKAIVASTGHITAIVGFVDSDEEGHLYNAAAVIQNGQLKGTYRKQELPNYGEFDEKRYFTPGNENPIFELNGVPFSITICEDIWIDGGPHMTQAKNGARLIVNISASPYHARKIHMREELLKKRARETNTYMIYNNLVGGQDELVFDGGSFVTNPDGTFFMRGNQFVEDVVVTDLKIENPAANHPINENPITLAQITPPEMKPALPEIPVYRELSILESIYHALVLGLRDYVHKSGFKKIVIGDSGGIDSALTMAIAVDALGAENVFAVSMPSRFNSRATQSDAEEVARRMGVRFEEIPIQAIYYSYLFSLSATFGVSSRTRLISKILHALRFLPWVGKRFA
ncbi:MAG: UDP-glucose 4-epimerase GalE, partial [Omnitrophica bacterium RIFCSPHIGHO2_12_FULL_44_12]